MHRASSGSTTCLERWEVSAKERRWGHWKAERNLAIVEGLPQVWPNTWYFSHTLFYCFIQHHDNPGRNRSFFISTLPLEETELREVMHHAPCRTADSQNLNSDLSTFYHHPTLLTQEETWKNRCGKALKDLYAFAIKGIGNYIQKSIPPQIFI